MINTTTRKTKTTTLICLLLLVLNEYFNSVLTQRLNHNHNQQSTSLIGSDINNYNNISNYNINDYNNNDNSDNDDDDDDNYEAWKRYLHDEEEDDEWCEWLKCDNDLSEPTGFKKYLDLPFLKKVARNLIPFAKPQLQMLFYVFRQQFPDCGKELKMSDGSLMTANLNPNIPTRIIIHGWLSQSRGSFNRDVKNAYLARGDYNIIVCDWSKNAANINYYQVVHLIETLGAQVADFTHQLNYWTGIDYDDIYLIGHSLGAHIAGAAGKNLKPFLYNTIIALDPAGPKFRRRSSNYRLDATDAKYVEAIQTSWLGFIEPIASATFYPNMGLKQKNCLISACSHIRSYKLFVESLTSPVGFWGIRCFTRQPEWRCNPYDGPYRMGGEPISRKYGIFYVATNEKTPFALGINTQNKWGKFICRCLKAHNQYRADHGAAPLKLDKALNKAAQNWAQVLAKKGKIEHSEATDYGENLYMCTYCKTVTGDMPVQSWYNEINDYDFEKAEFSESVGHFTQLVWKGSQKLGVGYVVAGKKFIVVCHYKPSGNINRRFRENVLPKPRTNS